MGFSILKHAYTGMTGVSSPIRQLVSSELTARQIIRLPSSGDSSVLQSFTQRLHKVSFQVFYPLDGHFHFFFIPRHTSLTINKLACGHIVGLLMTHSDYYVSREKDGKEGVGATYQKLRHMENPAARNGRLTARPSGKFWIPMPIARFLEKQEMVV